MLGGNKSAETAEKGIDKDNEKCGFFLKNWWDDLNKTMNYKFKLFILQSKWLQNNLMDLIAIPPPFF